MKEIEVKARLRNKDEVTQKLTELGCEFEEPVTQNDVVYGKNAGSLEAYESNEVFLRIRVKNGKKMTFTLKKPILNELDCMELETEISSKEGMEGALFLMGYKEALRLNKTRIVTRHAGREICIDEVEGLGSFIEVEQLAEEGDSTKIQSELFEFLKTLGVSEEDRVLRGYDMLMLGAPEK